MKNQCKYINKLKMRQVLQNQAFSKMKVQHRKIAKYEQKKSLYSLVEQGKKTGIDAGREFKELK